MGPVRQSVGRMQIKFIQYPLFTAFSLPPGALLFFALRTCQKRKEEEGPLSSFSEEKNIHSSRKGKCATERTEAQKLNVQSRESTSLVRTTQFHT